MSARIERKGIGERPPTRFEYTPNQRQASRTPLILHAGESIETVTEIIPHLLRYYFVHAAEGHLQPLAYGVPAYRVPYPHAAGAYLRVVALTVMPDALGPDRPALFFVVDLTASRLPALKREPPTICRVGLIGNLLFPPTYTDRGPLHNFGLPRAVRIYTASWLKPFSAQNLPPHPRNWRLLYEDTDLRGRWGWTYLDFAPARASHLLFLFSHLPVLPRDIDIDYGGLLGGAVAAYADAHGIPWHFRGLSVERLAIYPYENATDDDETVAYVPVTTWHSHYEPQPVPFVSKYWAARGFPGIVQPLHQSIYREAMKPIHGVPWGFDLQPSALVGLPIQVRVPAPSAGDAPQTQDGYAYRLYYSGDIIHADSTVRTNLVVEVTDTQPPALRGIWLRAPAPVRPEQTVTAGTEARCSIYGTDEASVAFSSNPDRQGWILISPPPFGFSFDAILNFLYGQEILFPNDTTYRFYRLEFGIPAGGSFTGPKRFELAELKLLRSRHPTLVAREDEATRLDEIHLRFSGPNLLDDYEYINGREIMDVRLQRTTRDRPFEDILHVRSLLDIREKTAAQIIAVQRATRPRVQFFRDKQDPTVQRSLSVARQTMLRGIEQMQLQNHPLVNILPGAAAAQGIPDHQGYARFVIANLLNNIYGVVTDRNLDFGDVLGLVNLLEASGVPAVDTLRLINVFANSSFNDLAGVSADLIKGALSAGLAPVRDVVNAIQDLFGWGDDVPSNPVLFNHGRLAAGPVPLIAAFNGLRLDETVNQLRNRLRDLPYRPSLSYSGSVGAQFIVGGSLGVSAQLDGGKSRALSWGTQGQANEALLVSDFSFRRTRHEEEVENAQLYDWKGQEVKRAGVPTDIITIRLPLGLTLTPPAEGGEAPDAFRVKVDLLPPNVKVEVRFVGQRVPLDRVQS